jgi:ABC-2 type transport system ATP-binding protein
MDAIVARGLTKDYRQVGKRTKRSLDQLSITIREGEIFGFLGHNGAGKTTAIKILCGLVQPTAGDAEIFGESVRLPSARRNLGYLPEQPYFYEYLTPRETLDFYGRLRGRSAAEREDDWRRLSELLDLKRIEHQPIKSFSKGMRQRIGFAVALVGDPKLLILDEPMSGLDPVGRRSIRNLMLRCRDEGKTLFFSSHVLGDVEQLIGAETQTVEVVTRGLSPDALAVVREHARTSRRLEELDIFTADKADGNALVRAVLEHGGEVMEFTTLKESLEEYFMREYDAAARQEARA